MVVRYGMVAASVGSLDQKSLVRSMQKSLLSALIGIAVDRGQKTLEASLNSALMMSMISLRSRNLRLLRP